MAEYRRALLRSSLICLLISLLSVGVVSAEVVPISVKQGSIESVLASSKAKLIYVDFWASWCAPCKHSLPWLSEMQERYGKEGLQIIAVNVDSERESADSLLRNIRQNFKVLYDGSGELAERFEVKSMPSAFLLKPSGEVIRSFYGFNNKTPREVEATLSELLAK